jgi:serine/threonine-protein kinase
MVAPDDLPSHIGRYLVERRLGQGGMADVLLCRQVGMGGFDRLVVVKQIRSDLRHRDDVIAMFLDEARIAAQISHPNVVQIIEVDEDGGLPYMVMEYVRGLSFADLTQVLRRRDLLPPVDLVAALGAQVCAGLQAAHELRDSAGQPLGVVHRDISPSNLIVTVDGGVKIIDFGIARAKNRLARTAVGHIKGRLAYLAPEMVGGGAVDRRADLFSLGVVMHEMMRGQLLFDRPTDIATVSAVLTGDVPRLSETRSDIMPERIIERALSLDPDGRPQTAAELGAELHAVAMQTGRYVSPPLLSRYLGHLLPDELASLPEQHLPTTARVPLPEHRPHSARPTVISPRPADPTRAIALRAPQGRTTERRVQVPPRRWFFFLVLVFLGVGLAWRLFGG